MSDWYVYYDGINDYGENELYNFILDETIEHVKNTLKDMGGGHADIYDEDGDFVEDVEV